jgi:hypothetical protein
MNTSQVQEGNWDYQVQSVLSDSGTIIYRVRNTNQGIFAESEMQLVWQRVNQSPLIYLIGQGIPGYQPVEIQVRDDGQGVWLVGQGQGKQGKQVIASLDLVSGEFHNLGDFKFSSPENSWSTISQQNGLLIQKRLTWSQDNRSGKQYLDDLDRGLSWELSEQGEWILKSGSLEETTYPYPASPYRMQAPDWVKAS